MKRVLWVVVPVVVAAVVSWLVAVRMVSPDQLAARAKPPVPGPVVAALRSGYLHGPVSMSATAAFEYSMGVLPPSGLGGVVSASGATVGQLVSAGGLLLRANGRPVFVLPGQFALYRDIQPGDTGDDVVAVQEGLKAAGYSVPDTKGVYGPGTQAALKKMYDAAGQSVPMSVADQGGPDGPTQPSAAPTPSADSTTPAQPGAPEAPGPTEQPTPPAPIVARAEIVMVAVLPATLQDVAVVGMAIVEGTAIASLGAGSTVLSAALPPSSVGPLVVGAVGTLTDAGGAAAPATIVSMTPNADNSEVVVVLSTAGQVTAGSAYVVGIDNPAAETQESILAPVAAVVSRGGKSYVYLKEADGFREFEVTVTGVVGGVAAIVAADPQQALSAGLEVRIE